MSDSSFPPPSAPPPYRPISALAVVGLVLSIVMLLGGVFGFWWLEIVPLLFCIFAWPAFGRGLRRGRGLAIAASIVAVLGALGMLGCHQVARTAVRTALEPVVQALHGEADGMKKWAAPKLLEAHPDLVEVWKKRVDAGAARVGAWTGGFELRGNAFFPLAWLMPTPPENGLDEVEPPTSEPSGQPAGSVWIRSAGAHGELWLRLVVDTDAFRKATEEAKENEDKVLRGGFLADVRVYVPRAAK